MKKKIIYIVTICLVFVVLLIIGLALNNKYTATDRMDTTLSLMTKQSSIEKGFKSNGYTIDNPNVIINPYDNSPLTALIIFETDEEVTPTITVTGKDELSTFTKMFDKGNVHYLPVYGLYPDYDNEVIVEYKNNDEVLRKVINIKTDALPENISVPTETYANKDLLNNDIYIFSPSSTGAMTGYDVNGDVRWYLSNIALWDNTRLKNGHILISTERRVNAPYYMTGLYEIDMLGKVYNEYSIKGGYHHDYFEMPNGNILVGSDDFNNDSGTVEDYIVELDRNTGDIVKTFDLKDVLNMEDGKSENWINYDWFHNNSVWYDEKTDSVTLSGRHQDAIVNISYKTGKLNWIIGDSTSWSKEYQKYFFKPIGDDFEWQWSQHAAMITPEGYVFVFDNGNNKSKNKDEYVEAANSYSRGVMYEINTDDMTIKQVYEYGKDRGSDFYSPYISDVDYLEKDHYIVHSGGISYKDGQVLNQPAGLAGADTLVSDTVELINNEVAFEIKIPTNNYRVEKLPIYGDEKFELGKGKKLGTLGKTDVDDSKTGIIKKAYNLSEIEEEHKISFTKEEDRLVFTGQFIKGTDVKIVLYKNFKQSIYNVLVSKRPYTALCVDAFTDEENENGIVINKYINMDGLNGKYSVYLEVEGILYKTNYYFEN